MITNITIKNIKGYGDPPRSIDLELKSDKINLLVAPNGFGKSSLAIAFSSLKTTKLVVEKDNKFLKQEELESEVSLTLDGNVLTANKDANSISSSIEPYVINTKTKVHTSGRNTGAFHSVSGYLDIEDIELLGKVPSSAQISYQVTKVTTAAKTKRGVINSETLFTSDEFISLCGEIIPIMDKFDAAKRNTLLDNIWDNINSTKGTAEEIIAGIQDNWFDVLDSEPEYIKYKEVFRHYLHGKSRAETFMLFYQVLVTYREDKAAFKKAVAYCDYKVMRDSYDRDLEFLNSSWNEIKTSCNNGKLIVHFPRADQMSNGQRDVLTMVCELMKFRAKIRPGKKYLLIIDEVFDYLDDANIMAAQFFLSRMTAMEEAEVYVCLLTHLSTDFFRSYVFSKKKINEIFLKSVRPDLSNSMKSFIAFRESLDRKNNQADANLYSDISHYLLHYAPDDKNLSADLAARHKPDLKQTWGKKSEFHKYIIGELNKYFSGQEDYDPYAVSVALRLRCEKNVYNELSTQELKDGFVDKWKTIDKFEYCEESGYEIPSSYYIVAAIHNETDHVKYTNGVVKDTPMVYKLQNEVIRRVLMGIFKYKGSPIPDDNLL